MDHVLHTVGTTAIAEMTETPGNVPFEEPPGNNPPPAEPENDDGEE